MRTHSGVNRLRGEKGVGQAGDTIQISGYDPHYCEEDVLGVQEAPVRFFYRL
ncbi:MAG TPA: hypothetical protein VIL66_00125 [Bacillota bacterium]